MTLHSLLPHNIPVSRITIPVSPVSLSVSPSHVHADPGDQSRRMTAHLILTPNTCLGEKRQPLYSHIHYADSCHAIGNSYIRLAVLLVPELAALSWIPGSSPPPSQAEQDIPVPRIHQSYMSSEEQLLQKWRNGSTLSLISGRFQACVTASSLTGLRFAVLLSA